MTLLPSSCALRTFCWFSLWLSFINFRRATFLDFIAKPVGRPWEALEVNLWPRGPGGPGLWGRVPGPWGSLWPRPNSWRKGLGRRTRSTYHPPPKPRPGGVLGLRIGILTPGGAGSGSGKPQVAPAWRHLEPRDRVRWNRDRYRHHLAPFPGRSGLIWGRGDRLKLRLGLKRVKTGVIGFKEPGVAPPPLDL